MSDCNEFTLKRACGMIKTYSLYKCVTERKKASLRSKPSQLIYLDMP